MEGMAFSHWPPIITFERWPLDRLAEDFVGANR